MPINIYTKYLNVKENKREKYEELMND